VFVIKDDKAMMREVTLAPSENDLLVVAKGL